MEVILKTVKWFKENEKIPSNAKLLEYKTITERYIPSEGGYSTREVTYFLYEIEFELNEESPRYRKAMDKLKEINPNIYYELLDILDKDK